jgi:hypothetical protein
MIQLFFSHQTNLLKQARFIGGFLSFNFDVLDDSSNDNPNQSLKYPFQNCLPVLKLTF